MSITFYILTDLFSFSFLFLDSNLSLLAVLDVNGVVHFYTVTELEELKPLGGGMRARLSVKGTGTVPSKSEEKILTECMSFSLEHEHVKSYDNVHRANIPIVDMRMDTSEYNRIILVSVDELGGVHTTVIGYQIFRGGLFVGQILPVDASAVVKPGSVKKSSKSVNNVATAEKQIHSPVAAEKTALVEVDANGEVKVSENANISEEDKASVVAEDSKVEAVVSASESVHRSEASILTSEFDKNAEKYGTSPSKVNIVWGGVVSQKSKVPLDMLNLQLSADVSTHMQPMSLLVLPNSLNNTRMTLADANRTSHIYAVGLSTGTEAVPGRSYPIVAFLQPDGAMLHSYSAAAPAAASITLTSTHMGNGAGSNTGAPFGVVDLAVVPSDSMVVAITRDSIHLISTKAFTADARERRSANFVNTAGSKNTWVFGMHECLSHDAGDADDNAEFYMMRQGGFEELVSVRLFNSRVVLLSVRMTSGVVNLYHIKYDLVAAPAVSDTSTGAATESKVKLEDSGQGQGESIPEPVMLRQYSAHYVGSIDPPYLPVTTTSTTTSSTSVSSATTFPSAGSASRMALFNFEAGKRSQLLLSSAQSCSVGLFNISSPIKVDAADDIVFFRRKFAPNCYRVEVHGSRSEALGAQLLSGVEIFTSTSVSSSTMTSGSIGGVSQAHLYVTSLFVFADFFHYSIIYLFCKIVLNVCGCFCRVPRKGPTTAALSQRRKPPSGFGPGGGPMTAGAKISAQSVISNYNNLIVAYNHYNATCADSDVPCEAIITGRVLFYEQLSNVDAQATEQVRARCIMM